MLKKKPDFERVYQVLIALLAIALPLWELLLSLSTIGLLIIYLVEGDFIQKWKRFKSNPASIALVAFYFMHLLGLLYTQNYPEGLNDLRVKLSFLILPLILLTIKPSIIQKALWFILWIFVLGVFLNTIVSFVNYHFISDGNIPFREITVSISHIRLSLMICISILVLIHKPFSWFNRTLNLVVRIMLIMWFLYYINLIKSMSAFAILALIIPFYLFSIIKNKKIKWLSIAVMIIGIAFTANSSYNLYHKLKRNDKLDQLEVKSPLGELYQHDFNLKRIDNGNYVGIYLAENELKNAWNNKSSLDFYAHLPNNEHNIKLTLMRYMTSKGLCKDASDFSKLSDTDIENIENGMVNYLDQYKTIFGRVYKTIFEVDQYYMTKNPSGLSFGQRLEYWRICTYLIKNNMLGVGTGDLMDEMHQAYIELDSKLEKQYQHGAHNQFFSTAIQLGIIGLFVLLLTLFLFWKTNNNVLYRCSLLVLLVSFLNEDTLQTQVGVTLFAVVISLFSYLKTNNKTLTS